MNELDLQLRKKLREAADAEPELSRSEVDDTRLVQALTEALPLRQRASLVLSLGMGLTAAAAGLLLWWPAGPSQEVRSATPGAHAPRCSLPTVLSVRADQAGRQRLDLGQFGQLVASSEAQLILLAADPCALTIRLEHGFLAGDLHSLSPAHLRIETPLGAVLVRGTRFSVEARQELEVVLVSGRVEIADEGTRTLEPRQVYRRDRHERTLGALQPAQAARIGELLSEPATRPAPEPSAPAVQPIPPTRSKQRSEVSSAMLLERAEHERRRGHLSEARTLYGQAAGMGDENGEVALLRWVRLELQTRSLSRVEPLLQRHTQRFPAGKLKAEAAWLRVQLLSEQGDHAAASRAARDLLQRFPNTPQASAAEALLRSP